MSPLLDSHREHLRSSGLSDETLAAAGICSLDAEESKALGYPPGLTGIGFPYPGTQVVVKGHSVPYTRLRVDENCRRSPGQKYENPLRSRLDEGLTFYPYIPPGVEQLCKDAKRAIFITEGEKKALKMTQEGFAAIGLPGVFMFVDPTSKKKPASKPLHPDLKRWRLRKRTVYVCFDSDRTEKESVALAHERLCALLTKAGAEVRVVVVPQLPDTDKTGADDFLVAQGAEAFQALVDAAQPWRPLVWMLELLPEALPAAAVGTAMERYRRTLQGLVRSERRSLAAAICERYPSLSMAQAFAIVCGEPDSGFDLPEIIINDSQLREVVKQAWRSLKASTYGPRLFRNSAGVVLVEDGELMPVDAPLMAALLNRSASWVAVRKDNEQVDARLPQEVPRDMLALPHALPPLKGISRLPLIQRDGSLNTAAGYDRPSAMFLILDDKVAAAAKGVPDEPSVEQRAEALRWLINEVLIDFPFARGSDHANVLGLLLLPMVRHLIRGPTPLHLIEAPSEGTGKTLLASAIALLAEGESVLPTSLPHREDELRKKITSQLLSAPGFILLDNLTHALDSESLAAVLTSTRWSDRILGQSKMVALPNHAIWMATANNPVLSREISRRTVRIRLDADMERPWLRETFHHPDLLGWIAHHRGEVIAALLTLVRGWIQCGRPKGSASLGSFDSWASIIGGILECAGVRGFLDDRLDDVEVSDPEEEEWASFVFAWSERFGSERQTSKELLTLAVELGLFSLPSTAPDARERSRFSRALSKRRDRHYDDVRICVEHDSIRKQNTYFLATRADP